LGEIWTKLGVFFAKRLVTLNESNDSFQLVKSDAASNTETATNGEAKNGPCNI
jgi:hypothetical protein